nr:uncharacterized protein LOC104646871 [Solanum lycopersicum]
MDGVLVYNNHHPNIGMAPFETLYGIIDEALEKVRVIRDRLATRYSQRKSFTDNRNRTLELDVVDQVYLNISPTKEVMRFGRKRKLSLRNVGIYEILQHVGEVDYELALPAEIASVDPVFHVSMLKKFLSDPALILLVEGLGVDEDLSCEEIPVEILDRQVKRLRNNEVITMKTGKAE